MHSFAPQLYWYASALFAVRFVFDRLNFVVWIMIFKLTD